MISKNRLKSEIEGIVRKEIHSADVTNISVSEGTGADDEQIIRVDIVFDNKSRLVDAQESIKVMREVRERLEKIGEDRFPVVYYVAKSEAGKLAEAG